MSSMKNAPNLDRREMEKILLEEDTGCLCLSMNDEPYGVPLSYAWIDGAVMFHCAPEGRKLDILRANPAVCFVVSRNADRSRPHTAEGDCTFRFESVQCFGKARIIDPLPERLELLKKFKRHFDDRLGLDPAKNPVTESAAAKCGCVVITVERMSGRRKE